MSDSEHAQRLFEIVGSSWMTQSVRTAAELRLAEHLVDGPKTKAELAALTSTQERPLGQLLRGLCAIGVCEERDDDAFGITPMGALLSEDAPYSDTFLGPALGRIVVGTVGPSAGNRPDRREWPFPRIGHPRLRAPRG